MTKCVMCGKEFTENEIYKQICKDCFVDLITNKPEKESNWVIQETKKKTKS